MEAGVSIEKNVTAERLWSLEEQVICSCVLLLLFILFGSSAECLGRFIPRTFAR